MALFLHTSTSVYAKCPVNVRRISLGPTCFATEAEEKDTRGEYKSRHTVCSFAHLSPPIN